MGNSVKPKHGLLSEKEKQYSWRMWLEVVWMILQMGVRHPFRLMAYFAHRSAVRRELNKSPEQRAAEARGYVDSLGRSGRSDNDD